MSHDRRRAPQPQPHTDPAERLELRLITVAESKPAPKPDAGRLVADMVQRLRAGGFDCAVFGESDDETPRTIH